MIKTANELLKLSLSTKENDVYEMYEKSCSYKEIMDKLNLEVPHIDNAIQRVRRKKQKIEKAVEKVETFKKYIEKNKITFNKVINWEIAEQKAAEKEIELPFEYLMFLSEIGNGGIINGEKVFTIEESLEKMKDKWWMPIYQNKENKTYYLGVDDSNFNSLKPKLYSADNNTKNAIDYIRTMIQLNLS